MRTWQWPIPYPSAGADDRYAALNGFDQFGARQGAYIRFLLIGIDLLRAQSQALGAGRYTERTERWLVNRRRKLEGGEWSMRDSALAQLVTTSVGASSPAWDRLTEIGKRKT